MINKMKTYLFPFYKGSIYLFAAVTAVSQFSCNSDKPVEPGIVAEKNAIIPAKNQKYVYKITDADGGVSSAVTKVTSVKDSAGLAVSHIENVIKNDAAEATILTKAFSQNGVTTNELSYPPLLTDFVAQISAVAQIDKFEVTGFPHYQKLENKGTVNSSMTFEGKPITVYLKLKVGDGEEQIDAEIRVKVTYAAGKVVKEENLTTPAGKFDCSKWEYSYEMESTVSTAGRPAETTKEKVDVAVWTAPGIGIVKSQESSASGVETTELQKIEK
jgi:hypothetical protein